MTDELKEEQARTLYYCFDPFMPNQLRTPWESLKENQKEFWRARQRDLTHAAHAAPQLQPIEGEYSIGRTLMTPQTKRWSKDQIEANDFTENRMVFANFLSQDNGRSRRHICTCPDKETAEMIVDKLNHFGSALRPGEGDKIKKWEGQRVKVKKEWIGPHELGTALGEPIMLGQLWLPVIWDHEEDPEFFKLVAIEEA